MIRGLESLYIYDSGSVVSMIRSLALWLGPVRNQTRFIFLVLDMIRQTLDAYLVMSTHTVSKFT